MLVRIWYSGRHKKYISSLLESGRELKPTFGLIFSNAILMALIVGFINMKLLRCFLREYNIWLRPSSGEMLSTLNPRWKRVPFFRWELNIHVCRTGWTWASISTLWMQVAAYRLGTAMASFLSILQSLWVSQKTLCTYFRSVISARDQGN